VEHPIPAPDALVRPWRTATFVASAVAALELLVLMILGVAFIAKPVSDHVRRAAEAKALAPLTPPAYHRPKVHRQVVGKPKLSRGATSVLVLNGSNRTGAAAAKADIVQRHGYRIASVGNAPRGGDYPRTIVMYRRGFAAEGKRLGRDLRVRVVAPLDGIKPSQLLGAHLVVILGR